ncbi:UDP-glucose 4-epimerase GalE [Xanthobacter sp. TB0139]|uniref:UDP-glucose 4-epimerase GalE n=1 Tax=Xanthobacter sp. TB0139 TaxID=3459178 RepID=UPI00403A76A8
MQNILVTGGAGYIGSHACKALKAAGYQPVAFDNLSTGWAQAVQYGPLVEGDLLNPEAVKAAFDTYRPVAVMHFAALSLVGESMQKPEKYWRTNVNAALNLIEAAQAAECRAFIFSSTCATYGEHDGVRLDEETPQNPINAYGGSKRAIENILRDFDNSHGLRHVIFRYFNVAGADPQAEIGEQHVPETHLIPIVLDAISGKRPALTVYGTDYHTPDGTCIRDYIHVCDLVDAHILGLKRLLDGGESRIFNLGTGSGFSVREVIRAAEEATGQPVPWVEGARRAGDAASLVSGSARAMDELGWVARRSDLPTMIADAWRWHMKEGFVR